MDKKLKVGSLKEKLQKVNEQGMFSWKSGDEYDDFIASLPREITDGNMEKYLSEAMGEDLTYDVEVVDWDLDKIFLNQNMQVVISFNRVDTVAPINGVKTPESHGQTSIIYAPSRIMRGKYVWQLAF